MPDQGRVLLTGARLIDEVVLDDAWVLVADGRIIARGTGRPGVTAQNVVDLGGDLLVPGFVDIHCHGGGGHSGENGADAVREVAAFHRRHGTTSIVVSLATAAWPAMLDRVRAIRAVAETDDRVLGSHLEGPFLDHAHRGAHEESLLRTATPELIDELLEAAQGTLRQVTLAPELAPGSVIDRLVGAGVRVAVGHTSATADDTAAAIARGASILTHAFNGMPGIHHRAPGPVAAAAAAPGMILEVIADGVHVDPLVIASLFRLAPERVALVTDAITAAGAADGDYPLGGHTIRVRDGIARIGEHGSLAGSTLTLDRALRVCVDAGIPLVDAVRAATRTPADAIGTHDRGRLDVGSRADLVRLSADLTVVDAWAAGVRIEAPAA
jgi:N-acetylglucosamine-6-phosphate deacetylase